MIAFTFPEGQADRMSALSIEEVESLAPDEAPLDAARNSTGDAGTAVRISSIPIPTLFRRWGGTHERLRQAFSSG